MKTKLLFMSLIAGMLFLAGCGDDADPVHGGGAVVFKTTWPEQMPASYVIRVGAVEAEANAAEATFPGTLASGTHKYGVFNKPAGLLFDGTVASAPETAGYIGSIPMLYGAAGSFDLVSGREEVSVSLGRLARNLKLTLNIGEGSTMPEAVGGELSGVAKSVDIDGGELSDESKLKHTFTSTDGVFSSIVTLFGITGQEQILTLDFTLPEGTYSVTADMGEALAQFNASKDTQLNVTIDVDNIGLESVNASIVGWEEGPIENQVGVTQPDGGAQVTFNWPSKANDIAAVEIYDTAGNLYASTVKDGKTTDLYERPADIHKIRIYVDGRNKNASLNLDVYNASTGIALMSDTYYIDTPEEMTWIEDLSGDYLIRKDLDMTGVTLDPIGYLIDNNNFAPFKGTFDGGNKEVSNFTLNLQTQFSGFISVNMGTIKNLNIVSGDIGDKKTTSGLGAICGYNAGTIQDCTNGVNVSALEYLGGIAGQNDRLIKNCHNKGIITGDKAGGGIVGYSFGSVEDCENSGAVTVRQYTGGIVGYLLNIYGDNSHITNCVNNGIVKAGYIYAGGIVGECHQGLIAYCENTNNVTAGYNVGGITGMLSGDTEMGSIEFCKNTATIKITTNSRGAGIAGEVLKSAIWACHNTGFIDVRAYAGGIAGQAQELCVIAACKNEGDFKATNTNIAGIAGAIGPKSLVAASYNIGNITKANGRAGGVVGGNNGGTVLASFSTGTINPGTSSTSYGGGVVGYMYLSSYITACYYTNYDKGWGYSLEGPYEAFKFNDPIDPDDLSKGTHWPKEDADLRWGVYGEGKKPADGYVWASLGEAPATYPTLWWEVEGMSQPVRFGKLSAPRELDNEFKFVSLKESRAIMDRIAAKRPVK